MTSEPAARETLPESVVKVLDEFRTGLGLDLHLWLGIDEASSTHLYPGRDGEKPYAGTLRLPVPTREGPGMTLEVRGTVDEVACAAARALRTTLEHLLEYAEEVRFFTYEVSERYEEINLLYSISETLGSLLSLDAAARLILTEVCDVMAARRGSLWVLTGPDPRLHLVASVGEEGLEGPIEVDDPVAVTAQVFREGRPLILTGEEAPRNRTSRDVRAGADSVLSVPIRYTPPDGSPRTVGVMNLIGRRHGGRFTASDQKLLAAIASQVGAALENNRLVRESLERERLARELELAHDLQMKLLPSADSLDPNRVAARVEPTESVGGDFYQFFRIAGDRYGVMIGDVSSHGFPAALIMALSMSAASIYASQVQSPALVFQGMGEALMDELESTEMYLTLFYGVVDPARGQLLYVNAGHPHAFVIRGGGEVERLPALHPPMGIAGKVPYQEAAIPWTAGEDLLLLFTDGLSDGIVEGSRGAGERKVLEEAVRLRGRTVSEIVSSLFKLQRSGESVDDRTAVALKV